MYKIGFYGNSCTGKTSSLYTIAAELTKQGKSFRILGMPYDNSGHIKNDKPFGTDLLESCPEARLYFLHDQLAMESKFTTLEGSWDFLLCEMTVLDLFYMYKWVCELHNQSPCTYLMNYVYNHMNTYNVIFETEDSHFYFEDGCRASGNFVKNALAPYYQKEWAKPDNRYKLHGPIESRGDQALNYFKKVYL